MDPQNRSRRFLLLAHLLTGLGVNLKVKWSWSRFRSLGEKGYQAFFSPRVRLGGWPRPTALAVVDEGVKTSGTKALRVRYEARACPDPLPSRTTFVPLLFHPSLMTDRAFEDARRFSENTDRRLGGFFAGNLDPAVYDKAVFRNEYGMLNRHEMVQILREPEFRGWLYEPGSWGEFLAEFSSGSLRERFTLIDVRRFGVPQNQWLELLSQTRCFLAPPGYTQPFCHNLIEALSVGAVPLTGYGHLLRPRLVPGQSCLAFGDADELRGMLRSLQGREPRDWVGMSRAAREYQQLHLSPQALGSVLESFLQEPGTSEWTLILSGALP